MIQRIHCDANLQRQLKALRKAGGQKARVAEHADAILERLLSGAGNRVDQIARTTRHGEVRIKKCIKYDLTEGYRLIGIMQHDEAIFLYIGAHDECDRWLTKNRGLQAVVEKKGNEVFSVQESASGSLSGRDECASEAVDDYQHLLEALDDRVLRKIFRGLTGG